VSPAPPLSDGWLRQAAETISSTTNTNTESLLNCMEMLESASVSEDQLSIIGKVVESVGRSTAHPLVRAHSNIISLEGTGRYAPFLLAPAEGC
jgi:hypothetical protein